jgi:hypothetical protein
MRHPGHAATRSAGLGPVSDPPDANLHVFVIFATRVGTAAMLSKANAAGASRSTTEHRNITKIRESGTRWFYNETALVPGVLNAMRMLIRAGGADAAACNQNDRLNAGLTQ